MLRRALVALIALVVLLPLAAPGERAEAPLIVFTSQSQGALFACRCPFAPEGGLARRAAVVRELEKRGKVVLVEAGGWMPGGVLDEMKGPRDELARRAEAIKRCMNEMGYDVIAFGPDDLAAGKEELARTARGLEGSFLRGNSDLDAGEAGGKTAGGVFFFSVLPSPIPVGLYPSAGEVGTSDPEKWARECVARAKEAGALRVVMLSQLPETETLALVKKVPGVDAAFVANRSHGGRYPYRVGRTLVLSVPLQGKALGVLYPDGRYELKRLDAAKGEDARVRAILAAAGYDGTGAPKLTLDFYFMSRCPYGRPAALAVLKAAEALGDRAELNLWFILDEREGKLVSLHGEEEVEDDRRMLAIWLQDRSKLADYIAESGKEGFDFASWLARAGLDPWKVKAALECGEVDAELKRHALRCKLLSVNASPTLLVSNAPYDGPFEVKRILYAACRLLSGRDGIPACKGLPECYEDGDCFTPGWVTVCEKAGTSEAHCRKIKDVEFTVTALRARGALSDPFDAAVRGMRQLMPGMKVREVAADSPEGQALAAKAGVKWLPAFFFPSEAAKAYRFKMVSASLERLKSGGWKARPEAVNANYRLDREARPGRVELFVSPLSREAARFLAKTASLQGCNVRLPKIRYVLFKGGNGRLEAHRGLAEVEEAARMQAAFMLDEKKAWRYVSARLKRLGSSYWDDAAREAGFEPAELKELALSEKVERALEADAAVVEDFSFGGEAFLLFENRELVVPMDETDLEVLLWAFSGGR